MSIENLLRKSTKALFRRMIGTTRALVRRLANAYDIRLNYPCEPHGQHPLLIETNDNSSSHLIPKSVYFNTRSGAIRIGRNVVFGEDVAVLTGKHMNIEESKAFGLHFTTYQTKAETSQLVRVVTLALGRS